MFAQYASAVIRCLQDLHNCVLRDRWFRAWLKWGEPVNAQDVYECGKIDGGKFEQKRHDNWRWYFGSAPYLEFSFGMCACPYEVGLRFVSSSHNAQTSAIPEGRFTGAQSECPGATGIDTAVSHSGAWRSWWAIASEFLTVFQILWCSIVPQACR